MYDNLSAASFMKISLCMFWKNVNVTSKLFELLNYLHILLHMGFMVLQVLLTK